MVKKKKILEITSEIENDDINEEIFWEKLEKLCKEKNWEIWDISDTETTWCVLPSPVTSGHGTGVQEITAFNKRTKKKLRLIRVIKLIFGTRHETVYLEDGE